MSFPKAGRVILGWRRRYDNCPTGVEKTEAYVISTAIITGGNTSMCVGCIVALYRRNKKYYRGVEKRRYSVALWI